MAINHCVSLYPSENRELQLNQIDFLIRRVSEPHNRLLVARVPRLDGVDTIAYAKGARTFERHIDIDDGGIPVSPYCSLPENIDTWFKAWNARKEMCGPPGEAWKVSSRKEIEYLDALVRGVYAARPISGGPCAAGRRRLPGHPASAGADLLP